MGCGLQRNLRSVLLMAVAFSGGRAAAQVKSETVSVFRLDDYGWQALPKATLHGEPGGTRSRLVAIDHDDRIVVAFTAREGFGLATRENPALSLHILRFNRAGRVDLSLRVPTQDYVTNGLYLGPGDQIIVRADDKLQMLIDQGREPAPIWQVLQACSMYCYVNQSLSRRTLVVRELRDTAGHSTPWPEPNSVYTIFDLSPPQPRLVRTCPQFAFYAEKITDDFAYWPGYEYDDDRTVRFRFCDVKNPEDTPGTQDEGFFPINDDKFLVLNAPFRKSAGEVKVVNARRQIKWRRELAKHDTPQYGPIFWATSDESGDRFAFVVDTWRGGSRFLDISGRLVARRVVVYSESGGELASIAVSTAYHRDFDFSLSPDGHRLAVLDQSVLTVAELK